MAVFAALYLVLLVFLGWQGYRRRREGSLSDFYLAGGHLGFLVLVATLYATQYSGNTFVGYTGQAYRVGFAWTVSVGMMTSIVVVYMLFAPRLHALAHAQGFVTPADWARDRFGGRRVPLLISVVMTVAVLNYLYAQFLAMGHFVAGMTDGQVPYWVGVVGLGLVIGVYETLGGMRSVAWTDVAQGLMLFVGMLLVLAMAWPQIGDLGSITSQLLETQPQLIEPPSWRQCGTWLSSMVLMGLGAAMYPQAIQRIYAARDAATLRRSLQVMVFMPFGTAFVVLLVGISAHGVIQSDGGIAADRVMPTFLAIVGGAGGAAEWAVALVTVGALAAMMSTADSALLSLSSLITVDIIGTLGGKRSEATLAKTGKTVSWVILIVMTVLALQPPATLWRLLQIKMELLIQVGPIVILGIRSKDLNEAGAWRGLAVGTSLALLAFVLGVDKIAGVHGGTWACLVNAGFCVWAIRDGRSRAVPSNG